MQNFRDLKSVCEDDNRITAEHCLDEMREAGLEPRDSYGQSRISLSNGDEAHFTRMWEDWRVTFVNHEEACGRAAGYDAIDTPPALRNLHKRGDVRFEEKAPGWVSQYNVETQEALNLIVKTLKALYPS